MKRFRQWSRPDWQARVEKLGLVYHTPDGKKYWDESAAYQFSMKEIEMLERAVAECQHLCLEAAQHVIDKNLFSHFGLSPKVGELITASWNAEPPAMYGRFDFAYDGLNPPKLLEYNADTPTALLEASVVQWYWMKEQHEGKDQWNSIHERLVAKWKELREYLPPLVHFASLSDPPYEDVMTITYLRDTAIEAGHRTLDVPIERIGRRDGIFVDAAGEPIKAIFKLYPWEWLVDEKFHDTLFEHLASNASIWMEPIWKMLWSNKALLPVLWDLFPNHANLLPAYAYQSHGLKSYVKKPIFSREGANITIIENGKQLFATGGEYGEGPFIYQGIAPQRDFDGNHAVLGCWVIDGEPAGMGIREDTALVTGNLSRFVPHWIEG